MFSRKPWVFNMHLEEYLFASNYVYHKSVLDVGCKDGYGSDILFRYASKLYACDKDDYKDCFSKRINFFQIDLDTKFFPDIKVDVIVALQVIEHLHNIEFFFENCKRILNPGGCIVFGLPINLPDKDHTIIIKSVEGLVNLFKPLFKIEELFLHNSSCITNKPLFNNVSSYLGVAYVR